MGRKTSRWPNALHELDLFSDCDRTELNQIASVLTAVNVEAGEVLLREGDRDRQFMVIANGDAVVTHGNGAATDEVGHVGPGSFVGELSLLDDVPRSATVTALTPQTIHVCNEREFAALLASAPSVRAKITSTASERRAAFKAAA